jgi:hypothetical protein
MSGVWVEDSSPTGHLAVRCLRRGPSPGVLLGPHRITRGLEGTHAAAPPEAGCICPDRPLRGLSSETVLITVLFVLLSVLSLGAAVFVGRHSRADLTTTVQETQALVLGLISALSLIGAVMARTFRKDRRIKALNMMAMRALIAAAMALVAFVVVYAFVN